MCACVRAYMRACVCVCQADFQHRDSEMVRPVSYAEVGMSFP